MTIYLHGVEKLAKRPFSPTPRMVPLRLHHLPFLGAEDVIVTPRPWSPLIEALLFWRPRRRPRIVQVADGIAFPINAGKAVNRRYGGLQRTIFADTFVALQNAEDFELMSDEPGLVRSVTQMTTGVTEQTVNGETAILVAGNDPFFDFSVEDVVAAFVEAAAQLRGLGIGTLLLSCSDHRLRDMLSAKLPDLQPIGRISAYDGDLSKTLLVGSPSTVLLDHMRRGGVSLLIDFYDDPVLARYMSMHRVLDEAHRTPDGRIALSARNLIAEAPSPLDLDALLAHLPRRQTESLPREGFLGALKLRLLVREIHLLSGGRP